MSRSLRILALALLSILGACSGDGGGSVTPTTQPPAPQFSASPRTGAVPLLVEFTDESTNTVTSWYWEFGDGQTSTLENPAHVYAQPGLYDVRLITVGPGGHAEHVEPDFLAAVEPVSDPSFESQTPGTPPGAPWIPFSASGAPVAGHVINPSGVASDNGMPTSGARWCEIGADSTDDAEPPSNPGGPSSPPVGGAGISQGISYPSGRSVLQLEAAFVRREAASSANENDWMSIDVRDGAQSHNLYYKDTFSPTASSSSKYAGARMTPVETVTADLAELFRDSSTETVFTLTVSTGNGGDATVPSKGYVDEFRFEAPAALTTDFVGFPTSGNAPLTVDFGDLSGAEATGWAWDFGDGFASAERNPTHAYAQAGTYSVTLKASSPGATASEEKIGYVTVLPPLPVAQFSASPTAGSFPLAVQFTNTSAFATSFVWDFGDPASGGANASTLVNPGHVYGSVGNYTVTLTATGPGGTDVLVKPNFITVGNPQRIADFTATPTTLTAGGSVQFTNLSVNDTSWSWNFGDPASGGANTSTLENPSHVYAAVGDYTVSLTVQGPGGSDTETKPSFIHVLPQAPVANFTASPLSGTKPLIVAFTNTSTSGPNTYLWNFGDPGSGAANTSTATNPTHTYASSGQFTVMLTATNAGGSDVETKPELVCVFTSWTTIHGFFTSTIAGCAGGCNTCIDCHDGGAPSGDLDLNPIGTAFSQLKSADTSCVLLSNGTVVTREVIDDFDPGNSALVVKLLGSTSTLQCGAKMPDLCAPPTSCSLPADQIAEIVRWIECGAPQ